MTREIIIIEAAAGRLTQAGGGRGERTELAAMTGAAASLRAVLRILETPAADAETIGQAVEALSAAVNRLAEIAGATKSGEIRRVAGGCALELRRAAGAIKYRVEQAGAAQ